MRSLFTAIFLFMGSAHADQITFLPHGDQSLAARLAAVAQAQSSIDLLTYEFAPCDSSTKLLLDLLIAKAQAGLKVRVNLDANLLKRKYKADKTLAAYLQAHNVQFKTFNDYWLLPTNNRSHIKMLVIDGTSYFVGGRNSADESYGLSESINYFDMDLYIRGNSAAKVQSAFNLIWYSKYSKPVSSTQDPIEWVKTCLTKTTRDLEVRDFMANEKSFNDLPSRECSEITYSADNPEFIDTPASRSSDAIEFSPEFFARKSTTKLYVDFMAGSRGTLNAVNQYYTPMGSEMSELESARAKGVNVVVLTNATGDALASKDPLMTWNIQYAAGRDTVTTPQSGGRSAVLLLSSQGSLNDDGPLTPSQSIWRIHTKSAVRDHRDVFVGSFNLEPRSYNSNLESGVVVNNCPQLAQDVEDQYKALREIYRSDATSCERCQSEMATKEHPNLLGGLIGWLF